MEARQWVTAFVNWYIEEHLRSGVRFVTPAPRHIGDDVDLLASREAVHAAAQAKHPERWGSRPTELDPTPARLRACPHDQGGEGRAGSVISSRRDKYLENDLVVEAMRAGKALPAETLAYVPRVLGRMRTLEPRQG